MSYISVCIRSRRKKIKLYNNYLLNGLKEVITKRLVLVLGGILGNICIAFTEPTYEF
jgi:hypothetical protein